jgi:hypothetical protein
MFPCGTQRIWESSDQRLHKPTTVFISKEEKSPNIILGAKIYKRWQIFLVYIFIEIITLLKKLVSILLFHLLFVIAFSASPMPDIMAESCKPADFV